jgi:uncharacterized membrane protein YgaE (UPF0421/DUF939 family)
MNLQEDNRKFQEELLLEQEQFLSDLQQYRAEVKTFFSKGPCSQAQMEEV